MMIVTNISIFLFNQQKTDDTDLIYRVNKKYFTLKRISNSFSLNNEKETFLTFCVVVVLTFFFHSSSIQSPFRFLFSFCIFRTILLFPNSHWTLDKERNLHFSLTFVIDEKLSLSFLDKDDGCDQR